MGFDAATRRAIRRVPEADVVAGARKSGLHEQLAVWRRDFANRIDGQSAQRTADLIRTLASASAA